jgi:hypothetical protein
MVSKVLVNPLGWAVVVCPDCGVKINTKPEKELQNKILDRVCICGSKYQLLFDTRSAHRKKCSFPGILLAEKDIPVIIKNISEIGASFSIEDNVNGLEIGSFYKLKMKINQDWIEGLTRVTRVHHKIVGVVFSGLDTDHKKIIGSYSPPVN